MLKKRGFTLIELLVVISIIALLLSILMPGLQKAKEMAKKVICATNLKNFATASVAYASDNNEWFPMLGQPQSNLPYHFIDMGAADDSRGLWAPYLGYTVETGADVFYCPSQKLSKEEAWSPPGFPKTAWMSYSYFGNYHADSGNAKDGINPADGLWTSFTDIPTRTTKTRPEATLTADIVTSDNSGGDDAYGFGYNHGKGKPTIAYAGESMQEIPPDGANCGKADGSVAWDDFEDLEAAIQPLPGKSYVYWGPPSKGGSRFEAIPRNVWDSLGIPR